jgi:hypothetical protein
MATYTKFNAFVADRAHKKHNLSSDQLKVFLTNSAPSATNGVLADITEISYTNLSSRDITTSSSGQTSGTYKLVLADLTLTASGAVGPFRYVGVYNDTATNKELISFVDHGSEITMTSGDTYVVDFDGTNGLFTNA